MSASTSTLRALIGGGGMTAGQRVRVMRLRDKQERALYSGREGTIAQVDPVAPGAWFLVWLADTGETHWFRREELDLIEGDAG